MRIYRSASDLPSARRLKAVAGNFLKILNPGLAAAVDEKTFDPQWGGGGKAYPQCPSPQCGARPGP